MRCVANGKAALLRIVLVSVLLPAQSQAPTECSQYGSTCQPTPMACTSPVATLAKISDDLLSVAVQFDKATNRGSMPSETDCNVLFKSSTVTKLGFGASCVWQSRTAILILLGVNGDLVPEDTVEFRDNVIKTKDECDPGIQGALTAVTIVGPTNPVDVFAHIEAPSKIGLCDSRKLIGVASGSGGRELRYQWSLRSVVPSVNGLDALIRSVNTSNLVLPSDVPDGSRLEIDLIVANWIGKNSTASTSLIIVPARVPRVSIDGPRQISPPSSTSIRVSSSFQREKKNSNVPICGSASNIIYQWQAIGSSHPLTSAQSRSSFLEFVPNVFSPGTEHRYRLRARYEQLQDFVESNITINAVRSNPTIVVSGCNRTVHGGSIGSTVAVDVLKSIDPDNEQSNVRDWTISWSCEIGFERCAFFDNEGVETDLPTLNIPSENLNPGVTYDIKVTVVTPTGTQASSTCTLEALSFEQFPAFIEDPEFQDEEMSLQVATLTGPATTSAIGNASVVSWGCSYVDGTQCPFDVSQLGTSSSPTLRLSVEGLPEKTEYIFHAQVNESTGPSVRARRSFKVPVSPRNGICSGSPAGGDALDTVFLLECIDWAGGSDLMYGFVLEGTILRSPTPSTVFAVSLPANDPGGTSEVIIEAIIVNAEGRETTSNFTLKVFTPKYSTSEILNLLATESAFLAGGLRNNDLPSVASAIVNLVSLLPLLNDDQEATSQLSSAIQALSTFVNDQISLDTISIQQLMSLFQLLTERDRFLTISSALVVLQSSIQLTDAIVSNEMVELTRRYARAAVGLFANLVDTSGLDTSVSQLLDFSINRLGLALGGKAILGQGAVTTQDSGFFDLSALNFDVDPARARQIIRHQVGAALDRVELPSNRISGLSGRTTAVFSSTLNYRPPVKGATDLTELSSLTLFDSQRKEIKVRDVEEGIIVRIGLRVEPPSGTLIRCMFFNETNLRWMNQGCTQRIDFENNQFVCNCTHLTSFQGVSFPQPVALSERDVENLNYDNLGDNPLTLLSLIIVFLIYIGVILTARKSRGVPLCGANPPPCCRHDREVAAYKAKVHDQGVRAFLLQWHYQTELTEVLDSKQGMQNTYSQNNSRGRNIRGSTNSFGSRRSTTIGRGSEEKDAMTCLRSRSSLSELDEDGVRQILFSRMSFREEDVVHARVDNREWSKEVMSLWYLLLKQKHYWISIFLHAQSDPFNIVWRANVLLQTLLLILCINGLFYGSDSVSGILLVAFLSAMVAIALEIPLVYFARKIGYLEWELTLVELRLELCDPISPTIKASTQEESSPVGQEEHKQHDHLVTKVRCYTAVAWTLFVTISLGAAFGILVLGMRLDLQDDDKNSRKGSRSLEWFLSSLIAELMQAILFHPSLLFGKSLVVAGATVSRSMLIGILLCDDDITSTTGIDIFNKVVAGHRLKPAAATDLRSILKAADLSIGSPGETPGARGDFPRF